MSVPLFCAIAPSLEQVNIINSYNNIIYSIVIVMTNNTAQLLAILYNNIQQESLQHSKPIVSTEASSEQEEGEHQPLTTPGHSKPLVSKEASSGAMICPESKMESIAKDNDKNVCPRGICIMKRPNSRTWWVSCSKCGQWYHIQCVKLTKKAAQNDSFNCKNR
jgi:hypothetical protein